MCAASVCWCGWEGVVPNRGKSLFPAVEHAGHVLLVMSAHLVKCLWNHEVLL